MICPIALRATLAGLMAGVDAGQGFRGRVKCPRLGSLNSAARPESGETSPRSRMLLTDQFVMLNFPRSGSTFAREALLDLYRRHQGLGAIEELTLPIVRTRSARRAGRKSQHGTREQIPVSHAGKRVVSIVRNPLDRAVSEFELGFWKQNPPDDPRAIEKELPEFPELSFEQYLQMTWSFSVEDVLQDTRLDADVGPQTLHFLRFYAARPDQAIEALASEEVRRDGLAPLVRDVHFLHTEDLVSDLRGFLEEQGIDRTVSRFMLRKRRVNASRSRRGNSWSKYFTRETEARLRHKERMLFDLFPEYQGSPDLGVSGD
jgi:hypothetical protein